MTKDRGPPRDAMQEFADKIIASLEAGIKPWVKPWNPDACGGPMGLVNAATGDRYHGINVLVLGMDERAFMTATPSQLAKARSFTGSTATQRLIWVAEIVNISAVDLEKLRRYFSNEAVQTAINAFMRDGGRELDGVKIEQKTQLAVR